ncbi:MAG: rhodanese-related sulfurtransferase [Pseudonocardiales bacterium]|nr:rhodanese-related sulfurtransferase [Pseudonocardiales bacterium]
MTTVINRIELHTLLKAGTATLIDALPPSYYQQQHLPGALNLVDTDVAARAADLLPDIDATIVTYCSNLACSNSKDVARRLERLGYRDVRTYPGGIQDWVEAGLPTEATNVPATA